jgi:predicted DNA-binding transcriptional regulator YafY
MPQNKNFQKRITILDACFAKPTGAYTLEKLINIVEENLDTPVSRRTIQNDIKYIKETIEDDLSKNYDLEEFPVFTAKLFDGKKSVFRYSKPEYALGNQLLSKSDQDQLEDTLSILSRYKNREDFSWLDEMFPRIKTAFNLVHEDHNALISYQSNRDYTGESLVGSLYNQLVQKKVLLIEYKSFNDSESQIRKIHPYHLKQYNDRWFLFGHQESEKYTGITNLALDRIVNYTETTENILPDNNEWAEYFDEIIGVSRAADEKPIDIKLRFSKQRIKYVTTKPIHGASQYPDKSDPENRTLIINLIPNRELYQNLFSFGADVEVVSPESVRIEMKKMVTELYKLYE